jgi:hypothetical protein
MMRLDGEPRNTPSIVAIGLNGTPAIPGGAGSGVQKSL